MIATLKHAFNLYVETMKHIALIWQPPARG